MRKLISMLGLLVGLGMQSPGHAGPASCDVSTKDGVRALYKRLANEDLETDHDCIRISGKFVGLVRVGAFYHNDGCRWKQTIYGCQLDPPDAARRVMAAAGWAKGDAKLRDELALSWLAEVEDISPLGAQPAEWPKRAKIFQPPQSKPTADGGLEVKFWQKDRPHRRPE